MKDDTAIHKKREVSHLKQQSQTVTEALIQKSARAEDEKASTGWLWKFAPLVLWTAFVLLLGTGIGAMNQTSKIIRPLLEWLFPAATPDWLDLIHSIIRKCAHAAEYGVLAVLAWRAFDKRLRAISVLSFVALVAAADELNQSFNSLRTASQYDVLLDIGGGAAAICFLLLLSYLAKALKRQK